MARKIKATIKSYRGLDKSFTQVANSMLTYIKDPYAFKIYFYLCMRYNSDYDYAFPSLSTMAKDCQMSLKKVKDCIKGLCSKGYIIKAKDFSDGVMVNKYKINFVKDDECLNYEHNCYVYIHKYKKTGKVLYVGKGTGERSSNLKDRNLAYKAFIEDVGKDNIEIEIVKWFKDNISAFEFEKELTISYKKLGEAKFNVIIGNPYI